MNLTAERERLADLVNTVVRATAFVPDQIEMITAVIRPGDPYVDYGPAFGDAFTVNLEVLILVPTMNVDFDWQARLDDLLSSGEVVAAIETDSSFNVEGAFQWGTTVVNGRECGSVVLRVTDFAP